MLARIHDGIRIDWLVASMDRGRRRVSLDCRESSQGSRQCHQSNKMKLAAPAVKGMLLYLG